VLALVALALGLTGLLRPPVLLAVGAVSAAAGVWVLLRRRHRLDLDQLPRGPLTVAMLAGAALLVGATLLAPPVMYDTLNYQLAFPAHWLSQGRLAEMPRHGFSYVPASTGMLYTYALAMVGAWGAKAIHLWTGIVATLAAAELGGRIGGPRAASWSALLLGLTPATLAVAGFAISDLSGAAWGGAALVVVLDTPGLRGPGPERLSVRRWLLLGVLTGTAAATKYLAIPIVVLPILVATLVVAFARRFADSPRAHSTRAHRATARRAAAALAAMALGGALTVGPWLARNLVLTGNPAYPFLSSVLGGRPSPWSVAGQMTQNPEQVHGLGHRLWSAAAAPVVRTFEPLQVGGVLGPHWLILLPAALVLARRRRNELALWLALTTALAGWGLLVQLGRYLIPGLVAAAALAGAAAAWLTGADQTRAVRGAVLALLVLMLGWNASSLADRLNVERLEVALGVREADDLMAHWVSYAPAIDVVNQRLPAHAVVLLVGEPRSLYLKRRVVAEDNEHTPLLVELAEEAGSAAALVGLLRERGVTHLLINTIEMQRLASMRGLDHYLAEAGPGAAQRINELLEHHLVRIGGSATCWVSALSDEAVAAPGGPGPGPAAAPGGASPRAFHGEH
jgi:hypothetical protein